MSFYLKLLSLFYQGINVGSGIEDSLYIKIRGLNKNNKANFRYGFCINQSRDGIAADKFRNGILQD